MKKLTCLGCATLGLVVMSACGSTTPIDFDNSKIWLGGPNATNQVTTQGYWWTYTDHDGYDVTHGAIEIEPGATISPMTNETTPLALEVDSAAPERGYIIHVWGTVPPQPNYADIVGAKYTDQYWKSVYPDSLIADYPSAGVGFGFQGNNEPYDVTQGKYVGFVFDMKTESGTSDISVSVPNVYTALPDWTAKDKFTKNCAYPYEEAGIDDATSYQETSPAQTCSANYKKTFLMPITGDAGVSGAQQDGGTFSGDVRAADGTWRTYCVLWSELTQQPWVKACSQPTPTGYY